MKMKFTKIYVDNQDKALTFYTEVLGFQKKADFLVGSFRWVTVVSPEEPDGTELLLEPNDSPAPRMSQAALFQQGIPATAFAVADMQHEYERLKQQGWCGRVRQHQWDLSPLLSLMIPAGTSSSWFRSNSCGLTCFWVDKGILFSKEQFEGSISVSREMTRSAYSRSMTANAQAIQLAKNFASTGASTPGSTLWVCSGRR